VTPDQKVLAVAAEEGGPYVRPEAATVLDASYPIARPLYMYTAGQPQGAVADYLSWILGEGQALIQGLGFVPLAGGRK
jgi:phosphate transport system substrate-binding protein